MEKGLMAMDLGNMFDFGGESAGDQPMQTVEDQGGFMGWLFQTPADAYDEAGTMLEKAKKSAGPMVAQTFMHKSLTDFFDGSDLLGVDLVTYAAPKGGGWWPDIALTDAGKKWALIGGAALLGFIYLRSR